MIADVALLKHPWILSMTSLTASSTREIGSITTRDNCLTSLAASASTAVTLVVDQRSLPMGSQSIWILFPVAVATRVFKLSRTVQILALSPKGHQSLNVGP